MAKQFKVSDVTGFKLRMREAIKGSMHEDDAESTLELLEDFCTQFAKLDAWKLRNERAGQFGPGMPCLHRGAPCIVVSCSAARVMVRKWTVPAVRVDHPISPKPTWLDPQNIDAITTAARWATWQGLMRHCGVNYEEWTTADFREAMGALP